MARGMMKKILAAGLVGVLVLGMSTWTAAADEAADLAEEAEKLVDEVAAAYHIAAVVREHHAHRAGRRMPAGRVEEAVRHPRAARAIVRVRRGVVRVVVVAEHPRDKRIVTVYAEPA